MLLTLPSAPCARKTRLLLCLLSTAAVSTSLRAEVLVFGSNPEHTAAVVIASEHPGSGLDETVLASVVNANTQSQLEALTGPFVVYRSGSGVEVFVFPESGGRQDLVFRGNGWDSGPIPASTAFWAFAFGAQLNAISFQYADGMSDRVNWSSAGDSLVFHGYGGQDAAPSLDFAFTESRSFTAAEQVEAVVPEPASVLLLAAVIAFSGVTLKRRARSAAAAAAAQAGNAITALDA